MTAGRAPGAGGLARAAIGIAGITVLARAVGFGRVAVLTRTVGAGCVGDAYQSANQLPNVVFEIVAGGALASLVVPLLAGPVAAGDRDTTGRAVSALLTWAVAVLTPVAVLGALLAPALMRALAGDAPACGQPLLATGARMLRVFMPQVVLYGVGIVLTGALQAHRRFLGPALAPLLSSLVVITAYLLYAAQGRPALDQLGRRQELTLSVGTTLGVVVLALPLLLPLRQCALRLRPTFSFPAGMAVRARTLAVSGVAGLAAQQLCLLVALRLANSGSPGDVVVFFVATSLFLLPWAVLAVPIATSVFPVLSAHASAGEQGRYVEVARRAVRALLVVTIGAVVVLEVVAEPAARVLVLGTAGAGRLGALADATRAFAPGLVGYGLLALLARALYARGDGRTPAVATVLGWAAVAAADLLLARTALPRVVALGLGNTLGMTLAGGLLLAGLRRAAGPAVLGGVGRTAAAGTAAGCAVLLVARLAHPAYSGPVAATVALGGALALLAGAAYLLLVALADRSSLAGLRHG